MAKESVRGPSRTIEYPPGSWVIEPNRHWLFQAGGCALVVMTLCALCQFVTFVLPH